MNSINFNMTNYNTEALYPSILLELTPYIKEIPESHEDSVVLISICDTILKRFSFNKNSNSINLSIYRYWIGGSVVRAYNRIKY